MPRHLLLACTLAAAMVSLSSIPTDAQTKLRLLGWNVESGGNDPDVIAAQLEALGHYHIVALTEVKRGNFGRYRDAVARGGNSSYQFVASRTGGDDSMLIIYDQQRINLNDVQELFNVEGNWMNDKNWRHRSPLIAKFYDRQERQMFFVMVNHLARGDETLRKSQAKGLRIWAAKQTLPVIAMGDMNFDYEIGTDEGNEGYDTFFEGGIYQWVKPAEMIDTNWADDNEDGIDDYPNSILDFACVANGAKSWGGVSKVIVRAGDFPDDEKTSDHRPVELEVTVP